MTESNLNKPLIICEAAAVKAAEEVATGYAVACIPALRNGALDSSQYAGRKVILWPDATEASRMTFRAFAEQINDLCLEIKMIIPNGKPHGWNITAAVSRDGMTWKQLAEWAKGCMITFAKGEFPAVPVEVIEAPDEVPPDADALWDQLGLSRGPKGGTPPANVDNVVRVLAHSDEYKNIVWYDEFYQRYFTQGPRNQGAREWQDIDDINLTVKLQRTLGLTRLTVANVSDAVRCRGHQCLRNEPREWIRSLRWDGTQRIDSFFADYFGCQQSGYSAAVSRNFWLGIVARVFQPGCQVDNMVILEGKQGIFKSKALEAIGGKWYMEASQEITSKDFFVALAGKLIVEIADLDSFSRADTTRIKKVITCRTDRYRQPYARATQDHPRQSIFVGTTNEQHYLRDSTGARRFWPITCGHIQLDRLRLDREQLYAEALSRYLTNEDWYKVPEEATTQEQEDRRQFDEWENLIQAFIKESCQTEIAMTDIASAVGVDKAHLDITIQRRIGSILRRYGWKSKVVRTGDFVNRKWVPQSVLLADQLPLISPTPPEPVTA